MTVCAPPPVTCPHGAPPPGERRCRHGLPKGAGDRPDEFRCAERIKANGPGASVDANDPRANDVVADDAETDAASPATGGFSQRWRSLFDHAPPPLAPPRRLARARPAASAPRTPAPPSALLAAPLLAPPPASLASAEDVAGLAGRYTETRLETAELGPVWLVAEPTGADRLELTYRDAATLAAVCAAFPGARVVALERAKNKSTESTDPRVPKPRAPWLCLV
jgi:hypothetical protein